MRDVLDDLVAWQNDGVRFALATVVRTSKSAPRGPGAALAVHPDGRVVGSVSGGCVEGAVVLTCQEVLETDEPRFVTYGYSDDEAFEVGLTCGGIIEIFVMPVTKDLLDISAVRDAVREDRPIAVASVMDGPVELGRVLVVEEHESAGSLGVEGLDVAVSADARGFLAQGRSGTRRYGPSGERRLDDVTVFVETMAPRPRMIVFGAIDFARAVAGIGKFLDYRVTVCDARERFATPARFPEADEVVVEWPHRYLADTEIDRRTVICVLTHDPKFDVPVLEVALASDAAYIGVMGSRTTHDDRVARLRDLGVSEDQLARLRSPIGLDLGGRTPEETAVAVAAEIVRDRWGGSGRPLTDEAGPIHHDDSIHHEVSPSIAGATELP